MMYRWKFVRTSDDCSGCTWRDNLEEVEDNLYDYLTQAAATDTENMKGELCQTPVIRREDLDTNYNTEEEYQAFERVHYSPKSGHFSDVVYVTTANN